MSYFTEADLESADTLKSAFKKNCLALHPDKGGSAEQFKETVAEFQGAKDSLGSGFTKGDSNDGSDFWSDEPDFMRDFQEAMGRAGEAANRAGNAFRDFTEASRWFDGSGIFWGEHEPPNMKRSADDLWEKGSRSAGKDAAADVKKFGDWSQQYNGPIVEIIIKRGETT